MKQAAPDGGDSQSFTPCEIRPWLGRYNRIEGDQSVFHVQNSGGEARLVIKWRTEEGLGTCVAVDTPAVRELVKAVLRGKQSLGGGGGGSFQINEFGQVLVPSSDGRGRRVIVGETSGAIQFSDPFRDGGWIDLSSPRGLRCGDLWPLPYVGMPYNLHKGSMVYFYRLSDEGGKSEYPDSQDGALIESLRTVRRSGAARFIVNPYGLVLTKRPPGGGWTREEQWEAVFVGRINRKLWFAKEG